MPYYSSLPAGEDGEYFFHRFLFPNHLFSPGDSLSCKAHSCFVTGSKPGYLIPVAESVRVERSENSSSEDRLWVLFQKVPDSVPKRRQRLPVSL